MELPGIGLSDAQDCAAAGAGRVAGFLERAAERVDLRAVDRFTDLRVPDFFAVVFLVARLAVERRRAVDLVDPRRFAFPAFRPPAFFLPFADRLAIPHFLSC